MNPIMKDRYTDIAKIVIWGEGEVSGAKSKPRLVFSFRDGNPRLTVYTGVPGADGVISFPADYPTIITILDYLTKVADSENGTKYSFDSMTLKYDNNRPTNEKVLVATMIIGKSKDGLVYMSVVAPNKPKVVFPIKLSDFHSARDKDGNELSKEEISVVMAKALVKLLYGALGNTAILYTQEEYQGGRKQAVIKTATTNTVKPGELDDLDDIDL